MSGKLARFNWTTAYRLGLNPWDAFTRDPELAQLVEGPDGLTPGRALDIGCGRGRNSIYLAGHGWDVTGVDLVRSAVETGRRNAAAAGVPVRLEVGDVTQLSAMDLPGQFDLLLDYGCYHALDEPQRAAYAAEVTKVAAPDATLWMYSFSARKPDGTDMTADDIAAELPGWELQSATRVSAEEMRRTTARLPLRLRPLRAAFNRGWFPLPWRIRMARA
jgi:cyclopropane fatty-acyl-phospholipid synthase-like methyltransferase